MPRIRRKGPRRNLEEASANSVLRGRQIMEARRRQQQTGPKRRTGITYAKGAGLHHGPCVHAPTSGLRLGRSRRSFMPGRRMLTLLPMRMRMRILDKPPRLYRRDRSKRKGGRRRRPQPRLMAAGFLVGMDEPGSTRPCDGQLRGCLVASSSPARFDSDGARRDVAAMSSNASDGDGTRRDVAAMSSNASDGDGPR
ncbi:unnamed protein product [Diplocarpon coronariae]|nr:hypothetical protein JHW43_004753 [Diplocarpon mali]